MFACLFHENLSGAKVTAPIRGFVRPEKLVARTETILHGCIRRPHILIPRAQSHLLQFGRIESGHQC